MFLSVIHILIWPQLCDRIHTVYWLHIIIDEFASAILSGIICINIKNMAK